MSRDKAGNKIERSIDGILSNLNIRAREERRLDQTVERNKHDDYEQVRTDLIRLQKNERQMNKELNDLKQENLDLRKQLEQYKKGYKLQLSEQKQAYSPPTIIQEYCNQPEGKRKLTIHLREIDYQAILKTSHRLSKGQIMETVTKALRSYIQKEVYEEAEKEVYNKAIHSVRHLLEDIGLSLDDVKNRLKKT